MNDYQRWDSLDMFTKSYIEALLFSETLPPYGKCPSCGLEDVLRDRWDESAAVTRLAAEDDPRYVCRDCSNNEPPYEPPADKHYTWMDLAAETLDKIVADCKKFQAENDLTDYPLDHAGYDFWMTRAGHGVGFWEYDFGTEEQCDKLTAATEAFGRLWTYVGDDGKIYF